jgi:excisionase family DNA binding protein
MSRRPAADTTRSPGSGAGSSTTRPTSSSRVVCRTVVTRRALAGRGWQPSSLFAAAAVASVAAELERRRSAPRGGVADPVAATQLVTPVEAARLLGVGRTTIYRLAKEHQLTRIRIGRCARFVRSEIDEFVESRLAEARGRPDG